MTIFLIVVGLLLDVLFICMEYKGKMLPATILKGLASLFFVLLGLRFFIMGGVPLSILILLGLSFGMIGDVFLNMRNLYTGETSNKVFAIGILAFLLGHFLYIAFLMADVATSVNPLISIGAVIVLTALLAATATPLLINRITPPSEPLKMFGYVYLTIVICMFVASLIRFVLFRSPGDMVFMIGALLFVLSDFIMIYYSFGKKIKPLRAINLLSYYIGQILIAFCIHIVG